MRLTSLEIFRVNILLHEINAIDYEKACYGPN